MVTFTARMAQFSQNESRHLKRLKQGSVETWNDFIQTWSPVLYSYACWNIPTNHVVPLMKTFWQNVIRSITMYDGRIDYQTWLHTLMYQTLCDWKRGRRDVGILPTIEMTAETRAFLNTVNELPDQVRDAMILYHRQGLSVESVAEVLGRTIKATQALLERGQRLLQFAFEDTIHENN